MLFFVVLLAVMSTALELMIAAKVPVWRRLSHRSKLFNLLNSLFISYTMGLAFGAAGLIAMTAGVLSTMLSVPGYEFLAWAYDSESAQQHGGNNIAYYGQKWKQTLSDLAHMTYKVIRFITFPIWGIRIIAQKISEYNRKFQNLRAKFARS